MTEKKIAETTKDNKTTGVVYITDNENMFIADQNLSPERFNQLALETDINAAREKLAAMEKELEELNKEEHSEEIERNTPLTQTFTNQSSEKPVFPKKKENFKNILILDTETTGLDATEDEILQLSAIDGNGTPLLDSYIKPQHHKSWDEAMKKNHITPDMVKDAPAFSEFRGKIQKLIDGADLIISYNGKFDMDFLQMNGIKVNPEIPHLDVMKVFKSIDREKPADGSKLRNRLEDAAKHFGISFNAHDSLEDTKATLKVAKKVYGENLERLTAEEINRYSPSKIPPKPKETKEIKSLIFRTGHMALQNPEILSEIKGNPSLRNLNKLLKDLERNPDDKKTLNSLKYSLGHYLIDKDPSIVENFSKNKREKEMAGKINAEIHSNQEQIIPPFAVMTKQGMKRYENMKVSFFDQESNQYYLENGKEKLILPVSTFQTIKHPEVLDVPKMQFQNADIAEETPGFVEGKTKIPELAMITNHGLQTFKDFVMEKYNEYENSYTLSNGTDSITVSGDTFKEITQPERFDNKFDENTPAYKKLILSQYEDFFKPRDNTANNFIHNLKVYSRLECNSPLDSLKVSKEIISRMDKEEQKKTKALLLMLAREDEKITNVIVRSYYDAIKEFPLNEDYIKKNFPDKMIARPFYDTLTEKGLLIDKDSTLRVGDTVKDVAFNTKNLFGHGNTKIHEDLQIISASKEGNSIVLMDKNKSYYSVPRDTFLEGYNKQQRKQHKAEQKHSHRNEISMSY